MKTTILLLLSRIGKGLLAGLVTERMFFWALGLLAKATRNKYDDHIVAIVAAATKHDVVGVENNTKLLLEYIATNLQTELPTEPNSK